MKRLTDSEIAHLADTLGLYPEGAHNLAATIAVMRADPREQRQIRLAPDGSTTRTRGERAVNPLDIAGARFRPTRQAREHAAKAEAALAQSRARLEELRASVAAVEHSDRKALGAALVDGKAEPASKAAELKAQIAEEERRVEALGSAVTDAHSEVGKLVTENRRSWRGQAMRTLGKARGRYEAAIAELEAAREGLANEATLIAWLDGGPGEDAASDFTRTLEVLHRDKEHLTNWPATRNDPHPEPHFELMHRAG